MRGQVQRGLDGAFCAPGAVRRDDYRLEHTLLWTAMAQKGVPSRPARATAAFRTDTFGLPTGVETGACGSLTPFSSLSFDTVHLWEPGRQISAPG